MKDWIKLRVILTISCLGIIIYSNTFSVPFILDDNSSIVGNASIKNIHNLQDIWDFWPGRFITYLSIAFNYHFSGLNVLGYHLFNLMIHLISAVLVWWLMLLTLFYPNTKEEKITSHANIISLLAGLIFVAHPVQTEAVTYIIQRAASMATLFYLASLCFYIKFRINPVPSGKFYYICSLITAILAIFTKEIAVTLPLMILIYEFTFLNSRKNLHWAYLVPFLLTIFIIPMTEHGAEILRQLRGEVGISPMHYLLTEVRVIVTYIRLVFFPLNQNLDYDYPIFNNFFEIPVLLSFLSLVIILFIAIRLYSKYRLISFSIIWFFLTLLPESSIFPIRDVIFEHRLYLPLVGYSMFLVCSMYYLFGRYFFKTMVIVLIGMIIFYSVLTYQRNDVWKSPVSLWHDTIQKSPHKSRPYNNLGFGYLKQGNLDQALIDVNKAIAINPSNTEAYINRGLIYEKRGKLIKALIEYSKAIISDPGFWMGYHNRAMIYRKLGNYSQAILDATKVIKIRPNDPMSYITRGVIYGEQGNFKGLFADFNKSLELDPNNPESHLDLGVTYGKLGCYIQAISEFNKALVIDPNYKEAYRERTMAYFLLSKLDRKVKK